MSSIEYISYVQLSATTDPVSFTSIPQTFNDLMLVLNYTDNSNQVEQLTFNLDTATNYSNTLLYGNGTSAVSSRKSSVSAINLAGDGYVISGWGSPGTIANCMTVQIMSYANASVFKSVLVSDGGGSGGVALTCGLWRSTAAITSLTLTSASTSVWAAGSTFTLWGVK